MIVPTFLILTLNNTFKYTFNCNSFIKLLHNKNNNINTKNQKLNKLFKQYNRCQQIAIFIYIMHNFPYVIK